MRVISLCHGLYERRGREKNLRTQRVMRENLRENLRGGFATVESLTISGSGIRLSLAASPEADVIVHA